MDAFYFYEIIVHNKTPFDNNQKPSSWYALDENCFLSVVETNVFSTIGTT